MPSSSRISCCINSASKPAAIANSSRAGIQEHSSNVDFGKSFFAFYKAKKNTAKNFRAKKSLIKGDLTTTQGVEFLNQVPRLRRPKYLIPFRSELRKHPSTCFDYEPRSFFLVSNSSLLISPRA